MIYLDAAATTPVRREALEAMWPYLSGEFGNPSSHHALGYAAADALAAARAAVAAGIGARASEIVFTSGGTEADNLAVKGIALGSPRGRHIVTTALEHEAVIESCDYLRREHGFRIDVVPVDAAGVVDLERLAELVTAETTLVTIMHANNEIGTIQPIARIAEIAHASGVPVHTDAVQTVGALPVSVHELGVDALSLSGHKLGAPKGVGALFVRSRIPLEPVLHGGGQERGARSGTENVAGAVALGAAMRLSVEELTPDGGTPGAGAPAKHLRLAALRDGFIEQVLATVPGAVLTGHRHDRLPGNASFCFPGTSGESVLLRLEERGIYCSSGSACAAGSDEPSHVLTALGIPREVAQTAVRFSFGADVTADDLDTAATELADAVRALSTLAT